MKNRLKANAFKYWVSAMRFLIPAGIVDISPGSRSDSDENPGILGFTGIRPR